MENDKLVIRKVGSTTVIIHPASAQTAEEKTKVMNEFDQALFRAWLNNQKNINTNAPSVEM